jgi:hypothetical protein
MLRPTPSHYQGKWVSRYEGVSTIFRTDAVKIINLTTKRVWKLPRSSTQLRAPWHTDSLHMVVLPSTGASRYHNFCIDGGTSPEYFGYNHVIPKMQHCKIILIMLVERITRTAPGRWEISSTVERYVQRTGKLLYMFFWVFPRRQIMFCRRFGTLCPVHLQMLDVAYGPDRGFRNVYKTLCRRGHTQKNIYNIQNTVKVWNQGKLLSLSLLLLLSETVCWNCGLLFAHCLSCWCDTWRVRGAGGMTSHSWERLWQ